MTSALIVSTASANPNNLTYAGHSSVKPISIRIIDQDQLVTDGKLIEVDDSYFYFVNDADNTSHLINRNQIQLMETNMDVNLFSLLKGKDPNALTDIIELNDGTRIPSLILDVGADKIQYFTGKSMKRESMPASSIYMLYLDNGTISIPFPVTAPDYAVL